MESKHQVVIDRLTPERWFGGTSLRKNNGDDECLGQAAVHVGLIPHSRFGLWVHSEHSLARAIRELFPDRVMLMEFYVDEEGYDYWRTQNGGYRVLVENGATYVHPVQGGVCRVLGPQHHRGTYLSIPAFNDHLDTTLEDVHKVVRRSEEIALFDVEPAAADVPYYNYYVNGAPKSLGVFRVVGVKGEYPPSGPLAYAFAEDSPH